MKAINPATGEIVGSYAAHSRSEVEAILEAAGEAYTSWCRVDISARSESLRRVGALLRETKIEFAELMTREMGKPIVEAEAEIEKSAWVCDFYADNAAGFLAPQEVETDASKSYVRFDPIGPILAVMPWNFPFWQVLRFAAPALTAGNVCLLKHASNVPGCALAIEELFKNAGLPDGAFTTLLVGADAVADLIANPRVAAVTLTGSAAAGRAVAAQAGKHLKKTVLELGGSDPFIVFADADLQPAAEAATLARTINSGQSCIAAKRFIVEDAVAAEFAAMLAARMEALRVGDPMSRDTQVGPLAREDLVDELDDQVRRSIAAGAQVLTGGRRLERRGYFYAPTVLGDVEPGMAVFEEETFGPVAAVIRARDSVHALELANRSHLGLGASLWTSNRAFGAELAGQIEAGVVFVNGIVKSDPRLPFGGVKQSGYGRELSEFGIREFVNIKTVWIA